MLLGAHGLSRRALEKFQRFQTGLARRFAFIPFFPA